MANTVAVRKLLDGHVCFFKVYLKNDGSGEVTDSIIIDPLVDLIDRKNPKGLVIEKIWYDINGFSVRLEFDDLIDSPIWTCSSSNNYVDFQPFGGLSDASGLDGTGKIMLTTTGFINGMQGSMILKVRRS